MRASRIASGYGAKVALLESRLTHGIKPEYSAIGGTCVNVGKLLFGQHMLVGWIVVGFVMDDGVVKDLMFVTDLTLLNGNERYMLQ